MKGAPTISCWLKCIKFFHFVKHRKLATTKPTLLKLNNLPVSNLILSYGSSYSGAIGLKESFSLVYVIVLD